MAKEQKMVLYTNFLCEWTQVDWKQYNWVSFTPIKLYFEIDRRYKTYELSFGILGFVWNFSWFKPVNDKEFKKMVNNE